MEKIEKNILIIGRTTGDILNSLSLNFNIFHFTKKEELKYGNKVFQRPIFTNIFDYDNFDLSSKYTELLMEYYQIDLVISFSEEGLLCASYLSDKYDIEGLEYDLIKLCSDKYNLRNHYSTNKHFSFIPSKLIKCEEDIINFLNSHKKIIIKPREGFGSKGIVTITSLEDVKSYFIENNFKFEDLFLEKYIEGTHLSVEVLTNNYHSQILQITEKEMVSSKYNVSTMQIMPARINQLSKILISESINDFLRDINFRKGTMHIELVLSGSDIYLIEAQPRPGGRIHEMLEESININIFNYIIDTMTSKNIKLEKLVSKPCVMKYIIPNRIGVLLNIDFNILNYKNSYLKKYTVNAKKGDKVNELKDTSGRIGHFILVGDNLDILLNEAEKLSRLIEIKIR